MQQISNLPPKGTYDWFPEEYKVRKYIFDTWRKVCVSFGYEEYLTPIIESADVYMKEGNKKKALLMYEKAYSANYLCSFLFIKKLYILKKELESQKNADYFLKGVILDYEHIFVTDTLRREFSDFCKDEEISPCPKIGWNEEN